MAAAPTLPSTDPRPGRRAQAIASDRDKYRWNHDFHGIPLHEELASRDAYGVRAFARVGRLNAENAVNSLVSGIATGVHRDVRQASEYLIDTYHRAIPIVVRRAMQRPFARAGVPGPAPQVRPNPAPFGAWLDRRENEWPLTVAEHAAMIASLPRPVSYTFWDEDWWFGWQRMAGTNPIELRGVTESAPLPDAFEVTDVDYARALAHFGLPSRSLDEAIAERRLYMVDFEVLENVATGTWDSGRRKKYLWAPMALFSVESVGGSGPTRLLPVAIQCFQKPRAEVSVYTPDMGLRWKMAKLVLQVADAHTHGIIQHLGHCHVVVGAFVLGMRRAMAPWHPVRVLLEAHSDYTLANNEFLKSVTLCPGGITETLQSMSHEGMFTAYRNGMARFDWESDSPRNRYRSKACDDREALPNYAFRDDEIRCFHAIRDFIEGYVALYYVSDEDVAGDHELRRWTEEVRSPDGGGLRGVPSPQTVEGLIELLSDLLIRITSYHNAQNYSVYPLMGFVPNQPLAAYGPFPDNDDPVSDLDYCRMMPPRGMSAFQTADYWLVSGLRINRMGHYRRSDFGDRRVWPLVKRFKAALRDIDDEISELNADVASRPAPYTLCMPRFTAQSITV